MKSYRVGILCLVAVLGAAACEVLGLGGHAGPDGISLEVLGTNWERGGTIQLRLRNGTERDVGYNLCFRVLERRVGRDWVAVQSMPQNTFCSAELRVLQPGGEAFDAQAVHSFIAGGIYRFRTNVEWPVGGGRVGLTSNYFVIAET